MRGISPIIGALLISFILVIATIAIYVTYQYSQLESEYVSVLSRYAREEALIQSAIDGIIIFNTGLNDLLLTTAMLIDDRGMVVELNNELEVLIRSQEYVSLKWSDLGFPTPEPNYRLVFISSNGRVLGEEVYNIGLAPGPGGGDGGDGEEYPLGTPQNPIILTGEDLQLFIGVNSIILNIINNSVIDFGEGDVIISSNIGIPINPAEIRINGTLLSLEFTPSIPETDEIRYIKEAINITIPGLDTSIIIPTERDDMEVYYPVNLTYDATRAFLEFLFNYIDSIDFETGIELPWDLGVLLGYTRITLVIEGLLADGRYFRYTGEYDLFIAIDVDLDAGPITVEVSMLWLQPAGLAEIEDIIIPWFHWFD